jgi:hypothetical protein
MEVVSRKGAFIGIYLSNDILLLLFLHANGEK